MSAHEAAAKPRVLLATLTETRQDFRARREHLVGEELESLEWLRSSVDVTESGVMSSPTHLRALADGIRADDFHALLVHIPIWTEPVLTVKLSKLLDLPIALLGNARRETSSIVGVLGAGGALDQMGSAHLRVFDHRQDAARRDLLAFIRAAYARKCLHGQALGLFGGRSLGIVTATADPAQWQKLFGVDIDQPEQAQIVDRARALPAAEVERHLRWLTTELAGIRFGDGFTPDALDRQVRSYLATRAIARERGYDFIGVRCQPELSDGYASQCVAHMLCNGCRDADGAKSAMVHACEADADGALTMQILHLLSLGRPTALLDVRWWDRETGVWTLANCGAAPAAFAGGDEESGLGSVRMVPHVFGTGGGGALPFAAAPRAVTLARLCRRNGRYWMAVLAGTVERREEAALASTTAAFPQAFVRTSAGMDFLEAFGSNHLHMVAGDFVAELQAFCRLAGIECAVWR